MATIRYIFLVGIFSILLMSCGLEQEVDLNLPIYETEMVVECYLEPGRPHQMLLTESAAFFDNPDVNLITDASVLIKYNDREVPLAFNLNFDNETGKVYTHRNGLPVPQDISGEISLEIDQPSTGRQIRAVSKVMPPVEINLIQPRYNPDSSRVLLLIGFADIPNERNYYRFVVQKDSLTASPEVSFTLNDDINDNGNIVLGTGFAFERGDTAFVTVYHIEKAYFDFLESRDAAISANGNPFGQPAAIRSNVQGGTGIFTNLIYDRRMYIVP